MYECCVYESQNAVLQGVSCVWIWSVTWRMTKLERRDSDEESMTDLVEKPMKKEQSFINCLF